MNKFLDILISFKDRYVYFTMSKENLVKYNVCNLTPKKRYKLKVKSDCTAYITNDVGYTALILVGLGTCPHLGDKASWTLERETTTKKRLLKEKLQAKTKLKDTNT